MAGWRERLEAVRGNPADVRLRELCALLERVGYVLDRQRGSHLIDRHPTRRDLPLVNVQKGSGGKAKPYQVRQLLGIIEAHGLEVES